MVVDEAVEGGHLRSSVSGDTVEDAVAFDNGDRLSRRIELCGGGNACDTAANGEMVSERAVISFFGIRGIGSFYYLAYALNTADSVSPGLALLHNDTVVIFTPLRPSLTE